MEHPNRTTTLQTLSEENAQRDLYRQEKGDGPHPRGRVLGGLEDGDSSHYLIWLQCFSRILAA